MAEIKTITSLATETEITFEDFWQFVWVKNLGENDCYVSAKSGISAGAEDVALVKAGETALVITETDTIYSKGATTLECHAQNFAESPFRSKATAGGGGSITIDDVPTQGSTNAVSSGGTYTAIQAVASARTLLYTSGDITQGAPYQTDVNLLDSLNKYDLVMILYIVDSTSGSEKVGADVYDVSELLTTGYSAYYAGYFCRWSAVSFTNTTFNQTGRGATNEGDQYVPQIYKIYGYKL